MTQRILIYLQPNGPTISTPNLWVPEAFAGEVSIKKAVDFHSVSESLKEGCDVFILNKMDVTVLKKFHDFNQNSKTLLLTTDLSIDLFKYHNISEDYFPSHIICANDHMNYHEEIKITLQKIFSKQIFGLIQYFQKDAIYIEKLIDREESSAIALEELRVFGHVHNLKPRIIRCLLSVAEELLMNALKSAPRAAHIIQQKPGDFDSKNHLNVLSHTSTNFRVNEAIETFPCYLQYAYDGERAGVCVRDSFGCFDENIFFNYLKKVLYRDDSEHLIDAKKSGAGLGLYKIIFESHYLICNLAPNLCTEVMAIIDLKNPHFSPTKVPKSLHFFQ